MKAVILTTISLLAFAGNSILCRMTLGEQEIDAASFTSIRLLSGIISLRVKMISSWPNGIVYFWLSGQLLCKAQRREHSRSYVTVVVTPQSDCPLSQKIRFHLVNYLAPGIHQLTPKSGVICQKVRTSFPL